MFNLFLSHPIFKVVGEIYPNYPSLFKKRYVLYSASDDNCPRKYFYLYIVYRYKTFSKNQIHCYSRTREQGFAPQLKCHIFGKHILKSAYIILFENCS